MADSQQIEQVLINLFVNAADAMTEYGQGTLTIKTQSTDNSVVVKVSDAGHGIPEDKLDGLSFLKKLQQYYPKPVVIVSTIAKDSSEVAENAVKYGAAEVIDKESLELYRGMDIVRDILIPKLRSAARKIPSQTLVY